jgi:hypothetical protein
MCGGWDIAKNVRRQSQYGSHVKLSVLTRLAGRLHSKGQREATELDLRFTVENTLYKFSDRWRTLLDEILEDGLLIRTGTGLAFCHQSFQEFLAAKDLSDPTGRRQAKVLEDFLLGQDRWREVLSFYVAMSNRPDEMASWIKDVVKRHPAAPGSTSERAKFLMNAITAGSPGWMQSQIWDQPSVDIGPRGDAREPLPS